MSKTIVKRTPEERKAQAKELHDTLAAQVEALRNSDEWRRFLAFAGSFHSYSFHNVMLILSQCPHATKVAGYQQWLKKSPARQVNKGEKAIKIFGYSTKKITAEDDDGNEIVAGKRVFYPVLSVFDISQTTLKNPDETDPRDLVERLKGDAPDDVFDRMAAYLEGEGWTISLKPLGVGMNGYTTTDGSQEIVLDETLDPAHAVKTLLHEAAHVTLHVGEIDDAEYRNHRGIYECEAEAVAYVLAGMVGMDTSQYSVGYVAHWTNGEKNDTLKATASNVMRAVHILAPVILPDEENEAA